MACCSSIARKPLLSAERSACRRKILVTGATGYIGSRVVERLLACQHNVHVLCRQRVNPDPNDMVKYLQTLPGAQQHLTVVSGDVTDAAALRSAMAQCEQLVHLAAVVDVLPPRDEQHRQEMIDTALEGTRLVLDAATASGTISKVILASSIVAIMWDWWERGADHVYNEEDWTLDSSVALNCYAYCKRESERLAYQMAQGKSWELVTLNPGIVFGPVAAPKLAQSASVWTPIVEHMNGAKYPFTSNMYVSHVDLDDVAAATCGLLATPGASGRHLLMSGPSAPSMMQIAGLLAKAYPAAKVPFIAAHGWVVALLAKYSTKKLGFDIHKFWAMHNKPYTVDASKIQRVLPDFTYIPLEDSVQAAADSVVSMGLAAFHPTGSTNSSSSSSPGCFGWLGGVASNMTAGLSGLFNGGAAATANGQAPEVVAATTDAALEVAAAATQSAAADDAAAAAATIPAAGCPRQQPQQLALGRSTSGGSSVTDGAVMAFVVTDSPVSAGSAAKLDAAAAMQQLAAVGNTTEQQV